MLHGELKVEDGTGDLDPGSWVQYLAFIYVSEPHLCCPVKQIHRQRVQEEHRHLKAAGRPRAGLTSLASEAEMAV